MKTRSVSRRQFFHASAAATAAAGLAERLNAADAAGGLKGRINHSACKWCYQGIPLDDLCRAGREMGLTSIDLVDPPDFPTLKKHGLTCAMVSFPSIAGPKGEKVGMQIMEGDLVATIQKQHQFFAHYHTGGVPGRHEIDDSQELNYPAIMRAIVATGFTGHVAQEFIPAKPDKLASLKQAVGICDV